jgi:hypothetical protein
MVRHHHLIKGLFSKEAVSLFVEHSMIFVVRLIKVSDAIVLSHARIELGTVRLLVPIKKGDQKVFV